MSSSPAIASKREFTNFAPAYAIDRVAEPWVQKAQMDIVLFHQLELATENVTSAT